MTTRSTRSPRRRTVVALAVVLAVLAGFVVRLVDIQVVNADAHIKDSVAMGLGQTQALYGTRGSIVDENGVALASSILLYDCQLDPLNVGPLDRIDSSGTKTTVSWPDLAAQISTITGQPAAEVQSIVADALTRDPKSRYALLKAGLSTEQYRSLMELGAGFIACVPRSSRTYPNGAVAGNLIGFFGTDGDPLAGLELSSDACMQAKNGSLSFERGKDGVIIPGTETETPAVDGGTLTLTIDSDLQWYLQQLVAQQVQDMGAKSGTISVVEIKTGKVRAMAEYPTVDPNDINGSDPNFLYSKIFTSTFEPGSTFKALTASTLIDAGGQTPTSTVTASSDETFDNGARVHDAFSHPAYDYTLAGVLIDSSNAGISKFSERVSTQTRYDYLKRFGIGSGSAIGFEGEQRGTVYPSTEWDNQTIYNTAFGQAVTTTVPELLGAYGAIANGGTKLPLRLIESCTGADGTVVQPSEPDPVQVISPQTSDQMREVLENVALQAGYAKQIVIPGYRVAVKTGTGEQVDETTGRYKQGVYFTTMIGFAPADDPQYLVAVTLDSPTTVTSSAANAPGFRMAMTQVLKTYRVLPSTSEPTTLPKFG